MSREAPVVGDGLTGRLLFAELNDTKGLRPGDFVEVQIAEPSLQWVAKLPASALSSSNKVLVVNAEDRLEEAEVSLVRRQGDDVLVRSRELRDARIVSERSPVLGAGIKVRVLAPEGETEAPKGPEMVKLDDDRRAKLIAFVEGNKRMPAEVRQNIVSKLSEPEVPKQMVDRLEGRMGG